MTNLTTNCKDCINNHTINCNNERRNSWYCPSYVKKLSEHERHLMKIAEEINARFEVCSICNVKICDSHYPHEAEECVQGVYDWMISLKENVNE